MMTVKNPTRFSGGSMSKQEIKRLEELKVDSDDLYTREILYSLRRAVCILENSEKGKEQTILSLEEIIF